MNARATHRPPLSLVVGWLLVFLLAAAVPASAGGTNLPELTLKLTVVNDSGGTKTAADFPLFIDGKPVANGVANSVSVGAHKASLINQPLYTTSVWGKDCKADGTTSTSLALGQHKTCTITVNDDPQATLTLVHSVVNDDVGTRLVADFPLFIDGTPASSSVGVKVKAGTHTVTITNQASYLTGSWSGACAPNGAVSLVVGDNKTCTITSNDVAPTLKIVNTVVNDDGGTAAPDDFGLKIDATPVSSGAANKVRVGTHKVTATGLPGYSASAWGGDCAADGTVSLALAENKTCTLTNKDAPAGIQGRVFVDKNGNGAREEGEPPLGSWTLYLDNNDNGQLDAGEPSASTDSDGTYQFTNLRAGTYNVRGVVETDWQPTAPVGGRHALTLAVGETAANKDFGYAVPLPPEGPIVPGVVESVEMKREVGVGGVKGMSLSVIPSDYRFFTNDLSWFQKYGVQVRFIDESHYEIDWGQNSSPQIQEAFSVLSLSNTFVSTAPGCEAYYYQDSLSKYWYCTKVANTSATYSCSGDSSGTSLNLHRFEELASQMSTACAFRQQLLNDYYGRCPSSQCFNGQTLFSSLAPPDQISLPLGPNDCRYYSRSSGCSSDPCANVQCGDTCSGSTRYYQGVCMNGSCSYAQTTCSNGCFAGSCTSSPSGQECDVAFDFSRALQNEFACTENIQSEHRLRNVGQKTISYDLKYRVFDPDNLLVYAKDYPGEALFSGNYSTYNFSAAPFSGQWTKFGSYRLQLTADGFCSTAVSDRTARQVSTAYASVPSTKCGSSPEGCSAAIQSSSLPSQGVCTQPLASNYSLANKGSKTVNYDFLLELVSPDNQTVASRSFRGILYPGNLQGDSASKTWFPPLAGWKSGTYSVKATLNGACSTAKTSDQKVLTTAISGTCSEPGCPAKAEIRALNAFAEGLAGATVKVDGIAAGQTDATGLLSSSLNDAACGQTHAVSVYCPNGSLCGSQGFRTDYKNDVDKLAFNCTACPVGERALALTVAGPATAYNGDTVAFGVTVTSASGSLIDGATLTVANPFTGRSDTLTTVNGKATYSVKAGADGFYTFKFTASKTGFKQATAQKSLAINSFNGKIKASVFNALGKPIAGAKLYLDASLKGVTDAAGALTVAAPNGTHAVAARCPDNSFCSSKSITVTGIHSANFACDCGVKAFVVVQTSPQKYPIANAIVNVDGVFYGYTKPNGTLTLAEMPRGTHSIEVVLKAKPSQTATTYKLLRKSLPASVTQNNQAIYFTVSQAEIASAPDFTGVTSSEVGTEALPFLIPVALFVVDAAFTAWDIAEFNNQCLTPQGETILDPARFEWTDKCTQTGAFVALDFFGGAILAKVGKVGHIALEGGTQILKVVDDIPVVGRFVSKVPYAIEFVANNIRYLIEQAPIGFGTRNISDLTAGWASHLASRLSKFLTLHPSALDFFLKLSSIDRLKAIQHFDAVYSRLVKEVGEQEADITMKTYLENTTPDKFNPNVLQSLIDEFAADTRVYRILVDPKKTVAVSIGNKSIPGIIELTYGKNDVFGWVKILKKHIVGEVPGSTFANAYGKEFENEEKVLDLIQDAVKKGDRQEKSDRWLFTFKPFSDKVEMILVIMKDGKINTAYPNIPGVIV